MWKKALCLIFAFLLSINSFAAIVSDNDGSAFVTKAEFEALKENFANQIVNYNNSIDSKIDGAIASYLAGIKLEKKSLVDSTLYKNNEIRSVKFTKDWTVPTTVIGDKCQIAVMFWMIFAQIATDSYWDSSTRYCNIFTGQMLSTEGNASQFKVGDRGSIQTIVCKPGYHQQYSKYYMDDFSFWKTTPYAYALALRWHSNTGGIINYGSRAAIGHAYSGDTVWNLSEGSSFGAVTKSGTIKFSGFQTAPPDQAISGTYVTGTKDEQLSMSGVTNGKNAQRMAGTNATGNVEMVKSENWNTVNNTSCFNFSANTNSGFKLGNCHYGPNRSSNQNNMNNWVTGLPTVHVYNKKNTQMAVTDLIVNAWTGGSRTLIYYYSGIPIFTAITNGVVEVPLKFTVDVTTTGLTNGATYSIKDMSFGNNATLDASNVDLYEDEDLNTKLTTQEFTGNTYEKKVYFHAETGKTYWIKVLPKTSNDVAVNTTSKDLVFYEGRD